MLSAFKQEWYTEHPEGKVVVRNLSTGIYDQAKGSFDGEDFRCAIQRCDLAMMLDPENRRARDLKEKAVIEVSRPKLEVQGFANVSEEKLAWIEVTHPRGRKTKVSVKVGQVFLADVIENPAGDRGYRLEEIINDPQMIVVTYLPNGKEYNFLYREVDAKIRQGVSRSTPPPSGS